jgi:hypothetical protein
MFKPKQDWAWRRLLGESGEGGAAKALKRGEIAHIYCV